MSSALDLGDLYSKLKVDFSDLAEAESHARKFSKEAVAGFQKTEKAGRRMKGVGKAMTGVSVVLVGAGLASAKMANDFDKNIAEINSLLPPTERNFAGLKKNVRDVAIALGTDLNESAAAAYQAISAGVPKDNLVSFLTVATKAAIAGVTNTEVAVDGMTTVMNAWKQEAGSANDVADVMFTAVKNGKTTFEELSRSMFQVAGIAPELGVSFKEISAAAATMTAQGVPTSVAMTQMRASMVSLSKPNKTMVGLLKAAGIESVKASIAQRGLVGTLTKLRKASKDSGISMDKAMGGAEAMGLVFKSTGDNAAAFKKNLDAMGGSANAMGSAFEEIDKVRGFDKLVNQMKALATIIGDALIPVLMPLAQQLAGVLNGLSELSPGLVQVGVVIAGVVAVMGPLVLMLGSALVALAPLVASAGGLAAALGAVATAAAPVLLVVAALAAGAYLIYKNWDILAAFFHKAIGAIVGWFRKWASDNAGLIANVKEKWGALVKAGKELWASLLGAIMRFSKGAIEWLNKTLEPFGGLEGAFGLLKDIVGVFVTFALKNLGVFFEFVKTVFVTIKDVLDGNISVWEGMGQIIRAAVDAWISILGNLLGLIKGVFIKIWDYLKSLDWKTIGINLMKGIANGIKEGALMPIKAARDAAVAIKDAVVGFFKIQSPSRVFADIGKFTMMGLAVGIAEAAPMAEQAAELAAGRTLMAYERGIEAHKESAQAAMNAAMGGAPADSSGFGGGDAFGGGGFGDSEFSDVGGGDIPGFPSLEGIREYYDQRLAILQEKGLAETQLMAALELQKTNSVANAQKTQLASYADSFDTILAVTGQFAGKQSGLYKGMFAVSKAFAIAEAMIAMQQNIANASKAGFPQNLPFIAGAVAQGAQIISSVQSAASKFYNGGTLGSGQRGIAGEKGVEIVGPTGVLSTQNTKEMFAGMGSKGAGSAVNVSIEIVDRNNNTVQVEQSGNGEEARIKIILDRVDAKLEADAMYGTGRGLNAFAQSHGLGRESAGI